MSTKEFFSINYRDARTKFLEAAHFAKAEVMSYGLPHHKGPDGKELFVDVAHLRSEKCKSLLVIISGTHGVEGFCGSGCQVGLLREEIYRAISETVGIILIHALNPYGFAWLRRVNEDNVDLNRNFHDFSGALPSSAAYEAIHDALVPSDWEGPVRERADSELAKFMKMPTFMATLQGGQYSRPNGLFFGGTREAWSNITFQKITTDLVKTPVEKIVFLDLHTGLGPPGYGEPIFTGTDQDDYCRAIKWFGPEVTSMIKGDSVSARVSGSLVDGIKNIGPGVQRTFVAIEYGTVPVVQVLTALRAENWLYANTNADGALRDHIKKQIRDAFYVDEPWWKAAVYGRAVDMFLRAGRGLSQNGEGR